MSRRYWVFYPGLNVPNPMNLNHLPEAVVYDLGTVMYSCHTQKWYRCSIGNRDLRYWEKVNEPNKEQAMAVLLLS